ncbi:hypothetical protein D051_0693 [Vibrio parahaemolyticus VPCR-2010]|uniref:ATP-grasp domain-containing protein n=1 Tax=Vibrio parahaemolyticus TaxID=670 RepID=UPI00038E4F02|nr:hypothetical protein D051_0693 [Vibrio parahaemolyticus VPCR-2010]
MKVFLQKMNDDSNRLGREEAAIYQYCILNDIPVVRFGLNETPVEVGSEDVVVGNIPCIHRTLRSLGVEPVDIDDYPSCLRHLMCRQVEELTVSEAMYRIAVSGEQLFAKPKQAKLFTGQEFSPMSGMSILRGLDGDKELYVSPIVNWLCEFRVYVSQGKVLASCRYDDNPDDDLSIDMSVVENAVKTLTNSGFFPNGYSLDFGLLDTGETALIELNDGYSLGKYKGISDAEYFYLISNRWYQLAKGLG